MPGLRSANFDRTLEATVGQRYGVAEGGGMERERTEASENRRKKKKQSYYPPKLQRFGHIRELTTGGSGTGAEPGGMIML